MSEGRKLIIHIGSHKTGSTSIQQTLTDNKLLLASQGLSFFNQKPNGDLIPNGNLTAFWFTPSQSLSQSPNAGLRMKDKSLLAYMCSRMGGDVLLSAEHFSWIFEKQEISDFKSELDKYFSSYSIICYIRRQDKHIVSHHQQGSKLATLASSYYYGNQPVSIPTTQEKFKYLDYNKKLSSWGDIFGDDNLIIRIFDKEYLLNQNVVDDFLQAINVNSKLIDTSKIINASNGFIQQKIGHLINQSMPPSDFSRLIRRNLDRLDKMLPSRSNAYDFYQKYKESNTQLNKRFNISDIDSIFSNNFESYPEVRTDLWNEDKANKAVLDILNSFKVIHNLSADDFRKAAIALENKDPNSSLKLMEVAAELRPNGKYIQMKLTEYQDTINEINVNTPKLSRLKRQFRKFREYLLK